MSTTPTPTPQSTFTWWQSLIVAIANVGIGLAAYHFGGPIAGAAAMGSVTAIAHQAIPNS